MNRTELIDALAARFDGNRAAATRALDAVLDTITREVAKGERVAVTGFGSFEKRARAARWARNPRTGARIRIKRTNVPKFTAGAEFRDIVSGTKRPKPLAALDAPRTAKSKTGGKGKGGKGAGGKGVGGKGKGGKGATGIGGPLGGPTGGGTSTGPTTPGPRVRKVTKPAAKKTPAKRAPAKKAPAKKAAKRR